MKKILLTLAAALLATGAFAEGYQVNNMSAKQTGMGHVGTAMKLNSESIFFNPAASVFQKSKFDVSVGFTGILSSVRFRHNPTLENGYQIGELQKSDNGLSTPIHAYFNYKPSDRWSVGLGFYVPDGSSMNWGDNWTGAHLVQEINLVAYTLQPTVAFKITDKLSIGVGATITWGNFDLSRALMPVGKGNKMIAGLLRQFAAGRPELQGTIEPIAKEFETEYNDIALVSAKLQGNADVAVGINAGIYYDINDRWSVGMTWRSRMDMKVKSGTADMRFGNPKIAQYVSMFDKISGGAISNLLPRMDEGTFRTELPLPTSVTWGVSFRPNAKWELSADLQWVGWSAYKDLTVTFNEPELGIAPIYSVKNYSNTVAYRVGAQYTPSKLITLRMGAYVDESPVSSDYLNPETPSMAKLTYTAGLSLRPTKCMSIDLAYAYVTSCDPERTGSYPIYDYKDPNPDKKPTDVFTGNYSLHANVFSIGMNFSF